MWKGLCVCVCVCVCVCLWLGVFARGIAAYHVTVTSGNKDKLQLNTTKKRSQCLSLTGGQTWENNKSCDPIC